MEQVALQCTDSLTVTQWQKVFVAVTQWCDKSDNCQTIDTFPFHSVFSFFKIAETVRVKMDTAPSFPLNNGHN